MRMILFAGKGGTGKTSMAAATASLAAHRGASTLVISLDPAHSLSDAFDLSDDLLDLGGEPFSPAQNLWVQEINVNVAIQRYWDDVHAYLSALLNTTGLDQVVAEEMAVLPGMEEISALLYINEYVKKKSYDLIILDCAPTAESMRFVAMPTALEWYMKRLFRLERSLAKFARPIAKRLTDIPLPDDNYFACLERLFAGLGGVDSLLTDPETTTVRLVANPEKMVLRETQRAFMYFSLHGLAVESVILNRVLPSGDLGCLSPLFGLQAAQIKTAHEFFSPLPIKEVHLKEYEVLGHERLLELGGELYGDTDPAARLYEGRPLSFVKKDGVMQVRLHLPFAGKGDVELYKSGDQLIVSVGVVRKHVALPHAFSLAEPVSARFLGQDLVVDFAEAEDGETDEA